MSLPAALLTAKRSNAENRIHRERFHAAALTMRRMTAKRLDTRTETWAHVKAWAEDRLASARKTLESFTATPAQADAARGRISELTNLLALETAPATAERPLQARVPFQPEDGDRYET